MHTSQKQSERGLQVFCTVSLQSTSDIIIMGHGLTTENIIVDNSNDMESPRGRGDRINQREEIRCE